MRPADQARGRLAVGARARRVGVRAVHPIGLGGMLLSIEGRPRIARALATIEAALDAGATLVDTADAYHLRADDVGHNESLVARALRERRASGADTGEVLVATKGGRVRPGDGRWLTDSSPRHIHEAARASARRLGVDVIDLYQLHAPDPLVPYEESVGAVRDVVDAGLVRAAGVSNVDLEQLETAHRELGARLVAVQNQFSPTAPGARDVIARCAELGLAFLAWRPLGAVVATAGATNAEATFGEVARRHGVSVPRTILAWHLAQSPVVIPIPGATRPETARDSIGASELSLDADDLALLSRFRPDDGR